MKFSLNNERDIFLKFLADIYLQNPSLTISSDTIYYELSRLAIHDGKVIRLSNDSLLGVQLKLNNKYRNNDKVVTFLSPTGYTWVIQNRTSKSDDVFYSEIENSIKLYLYVQADDLYRIADILIDFMINEDITMECKLSKDMRNDAFILRVTSKDNAIKVIKYLNNINYKSNVLGNPFIYNNGIVGVTFDNRISYNYVLSHLIEVYLEDKRMLNNLNNVSSSDFSSFIRNYSYKNDDYIESYDTIRLILNILDDNLSLDNIFDMASSRNIYIEKNNKLFSKCDEDKLLYVINSLTNYYSISEVHNIILKYIETGNINLFTKKDDIRTVISDNFSKEDVKDIISELGWKAFISASKATYNKYGSAQLISAINSFLDELEIYGFTRENNVRSYLGLVIPSKLLREVLENKIRENNMILSTDSLTRLVLSEIKS